MQRTSGSDFINGFRVFQSSNESLESIRSCRAFWKPFGSISLHKQAKLVHCLEAGGGGLQIPNQTFRAQRSEHGTSVLIMRSVPILQPKNRLSMWPTWCVGPNTIQENPRVAMEDTRFTTCCEWGSISMDAEVTEDFKTWEPQSPVHGHLKKSSQAGSLTLFNQRWWQ